MTGKGCATVVRGDGWIERRGGSLRVRWRDGESIRSKRVADDDEAERVLLAVKQLKRSGRYVAPAPDTVADVVERFLGRGVHRWSGNTVRLYRGSAQRDIVPGLGATTIANLTPVKVQAWVDQLVRAGKQTVTIETAVIVLGGAVREAVRLGVIAADVVRGVRVPRRRTRPVEVWSVDEIAAIFRHVADTPWWDAWFRVALGTGMRPGELRALAWGDVDMGTGVIVVSRTMTRTAAGREVIGTGTKTGGVRRIVIPQSVRVSLVRHRRDQTERHLASSTWADQDLVFDNGEGGVTDRNTILVRHKAMVTQAGVRPLHPHGMRHTYATVALAAGVPLKVVSDTLGHRTIAITADTYTHVDQGMKEQAAESIDMMYHTTTRGST